MPRRATEPASAVQGADATARVRVGEASGWPWSEGTQPGVGGHWPHVPDAGRHDASAGVEDLQAEPLDDPPHLQHMADTARNLFGSDLELFTHGTLENNMRAAVYGAMTGTNVRVGIEDNLFAKPGVPYKSNVEQVEKIRRILDDLNIEVASVKEARERLNLN